MKVGIIGHYGIGLNLANGQTIKTKIVTEAIEKNLKQKVYKVDAHGGIKAVIPVILGSIKALQKCDNLIIMLTENGLKVTVPVLYFFNKIFNKKIHYIVIGGWLENFLNDNPYLEKMLKQINCIYVETSTMLNALEKKGFRNTVIMPNCKELNIIDSTQIVTKHKVPLKICTFSRVMKEKGIEDLVKTVNEINKHSTRIILDIYGQVDDSQKEWFEQLHKEFTDNIRYCGVVSYDKSVEILKDYYALAFPTRFYTEGIPGTIIDAYASGVPVISSRWESFDDVVNDGETGIGYIFDEVSDLKKVLEKCIEQPQILDEMRENCIKKAKDFTVEKAMMILLDNL